MAAPEYISGLDLGQLADFSALVIAERQHDKRIEVQAIHRWPLGTSYPDIVADLKQRFDRDPLKGSTLIVDGTGVGVAVVDMIRYADFPAVVRAYSITCGQKPGDGTVPKKDLVGAVQMMLGQRILKINPKLRLAEVLEKELQTFRMKVTSDRNEQYAAWREQDHDDLCLALSLVCWYADTHGMPVDIPPPTTHHLDVFPAGTFRS